MYLKILLWRFEVLQMYLFYCVILQIIGRAKSCDPQHKNSGATYYIIYSNKLKIVFIILSIIYEVKTHVKM